jgi:hypothetical protein
MTKKPGVALVVSGTSKRFSASPVLTCSLPNPVPGSMRWGENVTPAALERPGSANSCSAPATPPGRCARFGEGWYV